MSKDTGDYGIDSFVQVAERTWSARTPFPWDASSQLHWMWGRQFEEFKLKVKPDKIVPKNKGQFNSLVGRTMVVDLGGNW